MKKQKIHVAAIFSTILLATVISQTPSSSKPGESVAIEAEPGLYDPSGDPNESVQLKSGGLDYVQAFMEKFPDASKRFALCYTLHPECVSKVENVKPTPYAIRIYNAMDDASNMKSKYFLICPLTKSEKSVELIPGAARYWQADIENTDESKTIAELPKEKLEEATPEAEYKEHVQNYNSAVRSKSLDRMTSFVISLRDYHTLVQGDAVSLRVYHGWDANAKKGSERIIVLVGVDANGASLWKNGSMLCDFSHLCPAECDVL